MVNPSKIYLIEQRKQPIKEMNKIVDWYKINKLDLDLHTDTDRHTKKMYRKEGELAY